MLITANESEAAACTASHSLSLALVRVCRCNELESDADWLSDQALENCAAVPGQNRFDHLLACFSASEDALA